MFEKTTVYERVIDPPTEDSNSSRYQTTLQQMQVLSNIILVIQEQLHPFQYNQQ
jgi:hypothetical protein